MVSNKRNTHTHTHTHTHTCKATPVMRARTSLAVKAIRVIFGIGFIRLPTTPFYCVVIFVSFFALACSDLGRFLFALIFCVNMVGLSAERIKIVCIEFESVWAVSAAVPCLFPETMSWHKNTKQSNNQKSSADRKSLRKFYRSHVPVLSTPSISPVPILKYEHPSFSRQSFAHSATVHVWLQNLKIVAP